MTETTVGKKKASHPSRIGPCVMVLVVIGLLAAIAIPNLQQSLRVTRISSVFESTMPAVTQAVDYAKDKGVYPPSLRVLAEEGYLYDAIPDKDPWGNDWVLSPVLTEGRTPQAGDDVYVYSRGPKGTGVYPEPFTHDTGPEGAIGYSSLHGGFGPPGTT